MYMSNRPFSPHPRWREHFSYNTSYPNVPKQYVNEFKPLATVQNLAFTLDPILNKYSHSPYPEEQKPLNASSSL